MENWGIEGKQASEKREFKNAKIPWIYNMSFIIYRKNKSIFKFSFKKLNDMI
jgi:hypothetical protein